MKMTIVWFLMRYWVLVSILCYLIKRSQADTCSLPTEGRSGDGSVVTLRIFQCFWRLASDPITCGGLLKEVKLERGVTMSLDYSTQGYDIIGKYFGGQVCVSWRRLDQTTSSYLSTQREEKCESTCFIDTTYGTYLMDGSCEYGGCWWLHRSLKYQVIMPDLGYGNTCPITEQGKIGSEERVKIDVWDCIRTPRTEDACGGRPKRTGVLVRKGVLTNLGYDVNDYAVMAKFFGDEVCVSLRYYDRDDDVKKCNEKCFSTYENKGEEQVTYRAKVTCGLSSCFGSIRSMKFMVTAKANIVQYAPLLITFSLMIVLTFTVTGFVSVPLF